MHSDRLARLGALMARDEIDIVAVMPSANLFYLSGVQMHVSERVTLALFVREGKDPAIQAHLIVPGLEVPRVESRSKIPFTLHPWPDEKGVDYAWASVRKALGFTDKTVAVDYYSTRILEVNQLLKLGPRRDIRDASPLFTELRLTKDAAEVDAMRRAAHVLDTSVEALYSEIRVGKTERELAARWQWLMFEHGADTIPDAPIVAAGPNSALPHTTSTARRLERGDMLILDGWCSVDGYDGDTTRTVAIGEVSPEMRVVYNTVLAANQAGRAAVKPGAQCQDVDRAARRVIRDAGFGEFFLHRTGHGLGLEVHEPPNAVEGDERVLTPGITFTVEPGIYLEGKGGVRIEDDVVVTQDGGEVLTQAQRELRVL